MVKIPGLDDLRKIGSDLIDSAKTVKLGEVVDKFKAGVESMGGKKTVVGDDAVSIVLRELQTTLNELTEINANQTNLIKKANSQLSELIKLTTAIPPQSSEGENQ